jgi:hypothetical protein
MRDSYKRILSLLHNPQQFFANKDVQFLDGVLVMAGLLLVTFFQKMVWVEPDSQAVMPLEALKQAGINSLMIWSLYCVFFFAIAGIFRRRANLPQLSGWVGAAGFPLVLTTLISALSWLGASFFDISGISSQWLFLENALSWVGLAFSWPGLFGFYVLHESLQLPKIWAMLLIAGAFIFLVGGSLLPVILSH